MQNNVRENLHNNNDDRNNHWRTALEPIDESLNGSRMMDRAREIRLDDLIGDSACDMNLNRSHVSVKLIRLIAPAQNDVKAMICSTRRENGSNNQLAYFSCLPLCRARPESRRSF